MLTNRPKTKLLVDGGDPEETLRIKNLIGFVDGQTTNPSLIARNPEIQRRLTSGHQLSEQEEKDAYRKIVQSISPLVGDDGVSIEVFADLDSRAEQGFTGMDSSRLSYAGPRFQVQSGRREGQAAETDRIQRTKELDLDLPWDSFDLAHDLQPGAFRNLWLTVRAH
jgi:hypothetical protein